MKKAISISFGAILLGAFIFAFMVGVSLYTPSSTPYTAQVVSSDQNIFGSESTLKREEIKQIIKFALVDAIKAIELRGGYLPLGETEYFPSKSVDYAGSYVPLYRVCAENKFPSFSEISTNLEDYFNYLVYQRLQNYADQDNLLSFEGSNFKIHILEDKVYVEGYANFIYKGQPIPSDYSLEVPTRLKEIYDFSTNYTLMMSKLRLPEYYFINLLYLSKESYFPTFGIQTKCGEHIILDANTLSARYHDLYGYFLANYYVAGTFENLKQNPEIMNTFYEDPPAYVLEVVGASEELVKYYPLKVLLRMPDDFLFTFSEGISIKNNKPISTFPLSPIGDCVNTYVYNYSFPLSYVVEVRDDLLSDDAVFRFAEYSFVEDMQPIECSYEDYPDNEGLVVPYLDKITGYMSTDEKSSEVCEGDKEVSIKVVDETGAPIKGAGVVYGDCSLGVTDSFGRVVAKVNTDKPYHLIISAEGYTTYSKNVTLKHTNLFKLYSLNKVNVEKVYSLKVYADVINLCVWDDFLGGCTEYRDDVPSAYIDISSHNKYISPQGVGLVIRKCDVSDELGDSYGLSFSTYDPTDLDLKDNLLYYVRYYHSSSIEVKKRDDYPKSLIASPIAYFINIMRNSDDPDRSLMYVSYLGQIPAKSLYLVIPEITILNNEFKDDLENYFTSDGKELNFMYVSSAVKGADALTYSKEFAERIYEMCAASPISVPPKKSVYPIRLDTDKEVLCAYIEGIAKECGVDVSDAYGYDILTLTSFCNVEEAISLINKNSERCYINVGG